MRNALILSVAFAGFALVSEDAQSAGTGPSGVNAASLACNGAIPEYRKALVGTPKDAALHNRLGVCLQKTGDAKQARKEYEIATRLDKNLALAWNNLGTIYHASGKYGKAIGFYRKAIEIRPDFAAAHSNLGAAALAKGDVEEGVKAYREALRIDPQALASRSSGVAVSGIPEATQLFLFAKVSAAEGRTDEALAYLTRARAAGFSDMDRVRRDTDFRNVTQDARFSALVR